MGWQVGLAALAFAALACSVGPFGRQQTGGLGIDQGGVTGSGSTVQFSGMNLQQLDSYVAEYTLGFEGERAGVAVNITAQGSVQRQRDPLLVSVGSQMSGQGIVRGVSPLSPLADQAALDSEVVTTGDTTYLTLGVAGEQSCVSFAGGDGRIASLTEALGLGTIQIEDFIHTRPGQSPVTLNLIGAETVNGVAAEHYRAVDVELGSLTAGNVDVWYVPDQEYVTRLAVQGQADIRIYGKGMVDLVYDIVAVNQGVEVSLPAGCQALSLEDLNLDDFSLDDLRLDNLGLPLPGG